MFHQPCTNKVAVHHGHCTKPTRIEYQWWCRIYRHCKRSVSLSFSRNLGSSNKTHGLFTDFPVLFPLLGVHQEEEEGGRSRLTCKSLRVSPRFSTLRCFPLSPTFFSTRNAITLIAATRSTARCVSGGGGEGRGGCSLSATTNYIVKQREHADALVRSKRGLPSPLPIMKSRVENESPNNSSSSSSRTSSSRNSLVQ